MIEKATDEFRALARILLAHEAGGSEDPVVVIDSAQNVFQKLHLQIAKLIGPAGFTAVSARALHLAQVESPFLSQIRFETEVEVLPKGLHAELDERTLAEASFGLLAYIANFVWLLSTLIGSDLVRRQLRAIWPELPLSETDHGAEERMK